MTDQTGTGLRAALADELEAAGELRSKPWRSAVEQVPREVFLGERIYRRLDTDTGTQWEPISRTAIAPQQWLELANQNLTWVTQFDATDTLPDGTIQGTPTSSSTLPGLVVRMLEDLQVADDSRCLEIGVGTGYSTGLMAARLGDGLVTSVEIDPGVAARARAALAAADHYPLVVTSDGLAGYADRAPYDRIIATCSVRHIPRTWLAQAVPGARIVATLSGWLYGSGLAAIDLAAPGTGTGHFLPGYASFMPARAHAAPPLAADLPDVGGLVRPVRYGADILTDWMGLFLAQLAVPNAQRSRLLGDADLPAVELITDQGSGSHAWLSQRRDGTWQVQQNGPIPLWDRIEDAYEFWDRTGRPAQQEFTIDITPTAQLVRLKTSAAECVWRLPDPIDPTGNLP